MTTQLLVLFLFTLATVATAAEILTDKSPASKVMAKYEKVLAAARKNPPSPGGVVCIGSSHMELWKTAAEDLAPLSVNN
jgi:hypothetical protein